MAGKSKKSGGWRGLVSALSALGALIVLTTGAMAATPSPVPRRRGAAENTS